MASKGRIGQGGLAVFFKIDFALSPLPSIFFSWLHKTSNSLRMLPMHQYLDKAFLAQIFLLMILLKHFYIFFCFCCKALISLSQHIMVFIIFYIFYAFIRSKIYSLIHYYILSIIPGPSHTNKLDQWGFYCIGKFLSSFRKQRIIDCGSQFESD